MNEHDKGWIEALIDSEGWLGADNAGYPRLSISNTNREFLGKAQGLIGGRVYNQAVRRSWHSPAYQLQVAGEGLKWLLQRITLVVKERQRLLLLEMFSLMLNTHQNGIQGPWRNKNRPRMLQIAYELRTLNAHPHEK